MAWGKIDDKLHGHWKVAEAGVEPMGLWVLALSWCRDARTNGFVPAAKARQLGGRSAKKLIAKLVAARLWREVDGGYEFHDFDDWQETDREAQVSATRRDAGKKGAARRWQKPWQRPSDAMANGMAKPLAKNGSLDPSPSPSPSPDPEALSPARAPAQGTGLSAGQLGRVFDAVTGRPASNDLARLADVADRIERHRLMAHPERPAEEHAELLVRSFVEMVRSWRAEGRPAPRNLSVEKLGEHLPAAIDWSEGIRDSPSRAARASPGATAPKPVDKNLPPPGTRVRM